MNTVTHKVQHEGRNYEVDVTKFNDGQHHAMYETHQIYRIRANGTRGQKLTSHHKYAWAVIQKIK